MLFTTVWFILLFPFTDTLDGKEISPTARQFLQNWKASKEAQKKRREELEQLGGAGDTVDRPPVQPYSIGNCVQPSVPYWTNVECHWIPKQFSIQCGVLCWSPAVQNFWTGIPWITQSKAQMLSLTENDGNSKKMCCGKLFNWFATTTHHYLCIVVLAQAVIYFGIVITCCVSLLPFHNLLRLKKYS